MELLTEIEIVSLSTYSFLLTVSILLQYEVISKVLDRQQALQTRVHVAVECIIMQTDYSVLKLG